MHFQIILVIAISPVFNRELCKTLVIGCEPINKGRNFHTQIEVCMSGLRGRRNVVFRVCFVNVEKICNEHHVLTPKLTYFCKRTLLTRIRHGCIEPGPQKHEANDLMRSPED